MEAVRTGIHADIYAALSALPEMLLQRIGRRHLVQHAALA